MALDENEEPVPEQEPTKPTGKALDKHAPPPLPVTRVDLEKGRKVFIQKSINDYADEIHGILWEDPEYQKWFKAIYNSQAIEGHTTADQYKAAERVRDYAKAHNMPSMIADANLHSIYLALNVVRRRLEIDIKHRRNMIGDEEVPDGGDGDDE